VLLATILSTKKHIGFRPHFTHFVLEITYNCDYADKTPTQ
jgi:hypothetical protein